METADTGTRRKKQNKWLGIASAIVVLLLIGAAAVAIATSISSSSKKQFTAAANISEPYVATIADTVLGQTHHSTIVASDGHGDYNYTSTHHGMSKSTIYTPDGFYQCNSASEPCVKYPNDPSITNTDPSGFSFSLAKIKDLKTTAKYSGQQKCPDGKNGCDVWYTTTKYNTSTYYYINTATKQIMQTIHYGRFSEDKNSTKVTIEVTYDYKNVTVTIPTNYTIAPKTQ